MSNTARALIAAGGAHLMARRFPELSGWKLLLPVAAAWFPIATALLAVGWLGLDRVGRRLAARDREATARADVVALAELTALGLAAGLDFSGSLQRAARPLSAEIRSEVRAVLRRARILGLSVALGGEIGRSRRLFRLAARAVDTGAPVRGAVEAFVDDAVSEQQARRLVAIRRLPVKLLFPLALLILPGFMVLTVGPALLGSVRRLAM